MSKKKKRVVVGSIVKSKEKGKPDYIKVRGDHKLTDGQFINLESAASQLASLEASVAAGKIDEEFAQKIRDRIEKIPSFVRYEMVMLVDVEE